MLPIIEDPNTQKQLRRSEQIKKWNEREMMSNISNNTNNVNMDDDEINTKLTINDKYDMYNRSSKVRFPKGCVFLAACSSGDTDEVRIHLKIGVNINTTNIDGLTALHQACIDANIEMVKFLVENNADINSQDNEGWTPLHAAVSVGNLEVSKYLISKGARLNICNNDSDLPIDLCDSSNTQMKEFLDDEMKRQGIDADYERKKEELIMYEDARDKKFEDKIHSKTGATPLHVSAAKGYSRVMRILLQSGADVNAVDKDGWTPLHAAAHWEQEEACKILCEHGADFEIRTYSEQTPYDVCEGEMITKLKQMEANSKQNNQNNKLTDVTSINNKLKTDPRNIRQSDEFTKPSIVRTTNDDKSILNDKKQDKILLSPIIMPPLQSTSTTTINHINESNENNESNDKENKQKSSNNGSTSNSITTNLIPANNQEINQTKSSMSKSTSSISRPKPGLHESLKSLSAQVRMMDEEKEDLSEKSARWGPTDTSTTTTATFKRRTGLNNEDNSSKPSSTVFSSTNPITTNATVVTSNSTPLSPSSQSNNDTVPASPNSLNNSDSNSRRYSSAPVASKDEQAELIRKQKAKLERHFRRSTTAVSYEDIKSAEATIKGGVSTSNVALNKTDDKTPTSSPVAPTAPAVTGTTDFTNQPPSTPPPPIPTLNVTTPAPTTLAHGVSSLSTLFGEPIKQNNIYHTPATFLSNSSITPLATPSLSASQQSSLIDSQRSMMSKAQIDLTQTPPNSHVNNNNSNESTEKDNIIANDIETDKLLNVIEKSKGFSDSKSTTAIRRHRNRQIPFYGINNLTNDESQLGGNNVKKINKLVWNPDRLEIEYKDEDHRGSASSPDHLDSNPNSNTTTINRQSNMSPQQNSADTSTENVFQNTSATAAPITNNTTMNTLITNTQPHTGRSLFRFENNNTTNQVPNTNNINRTNIKRSVSQVPSTDRRPLSSTNATNTTSLISATPFLTSPNTSSTTSSFVSNPPEVKITDYQTAYEQTKKENESLNQLIIQLRKELDESKRNQMTNENGSLDKREKRAFDRRISELEEEVKKVENLKQDNSRLKEENAALIRVISKLSK